MFFVRLFEVFVAVVLFCFACGWGEGCKRICPYMSVMFASVFLSLTFSVCLSVCLSLSLSLSVFSVFIPVADIQLFVSSVELLWCHNI